MKIHLFDSWHLPHIAHSKAELKETEFDILTLLAFSIGVPLVILDNLPLLQMLFGWTLP